MAKPGKPSASSSAAQRKGKAIARPQATKPPLLPVKGSLTPPPPCGEDSYPSPRLTPERPASSSFIRSPVSTSSQPESPTPFGIEDLHVTKYQRLPAPSSTVELSSPLPTFAVIPPEAAQSRPTLDSSSPTGHRYQTVKEAARDPAAPEELKALDEFFSFHPPKLEKAPKHTPSEGTKPPQSYDRHFSLDRVLKNVVYCPELETDLRNLADKVALDRVYGGQLPRIGGSFPTPQLRELFEVNSKIKMTSEADVNDYYGNTTGRFASAVAATLQFGHQEWSRGILEWTQTRTGLGSEAIADGYLGFSSPPFETEDIKIIPVEKLTKFGGKTLVTWEFKSIVVGDEALMAAIMELAGSKFDWMPCEYGHRSERCKGVHKPNSGAGDDCLVVTPDMGPDATGPDANELWKSTFAAKTDRLWTRDRYFHAGPPLTLKEMRRMKTHLRNAPEHARYMVQQVWAQATKLDLTLFVIQAGLFEIICRRDRSRQAMHISKIIEVWNTDYGQLHTGLYLASIQDAEIRISLADALAKANGKEPEIPQARSFSQRDLLTQACFRNQLLLHFQSEPRMQMLAGRTRTLREGDAYHRFPAYAHTYPSDTIRVSINEALPHSAIFIGTLFIDNVPFSGFRDVRRKTLFNGKVVIKAADDPESIRKLEKECNVYTLLASNPSTRALVPVVIGFFRSSDNTNSRPSCILLLDHAGHHLKKATDGGDKAKLACLQSSFKAALAEIHNAGLLHSDIRSHHLLVRDFDRKLLTFISFAEAEPVSGDEKEAEREKAYEMSQLDYRFPHKKRAANDHESLCSVDLSSQGDPMSPDGFMNDPNIGFFPHTSYSWITQDLVPTAPDDDGNNAPTKTEA